MAARPPTVTFENVLAIAGRKSSRALVDDYGAYIANLTQNYIWDRYDFRWTLGTLQPFWLVPNEQDYGAPAVTVPTDYFGLRTAYLIQLNSEPPYRMPLKLIKDLNDTHIRYYPHAIWYQPDKEAFRVFPRTPENIGSPNWMIYGTYKKLPPQLTANTLPATLLPSDDFYTDVWVETAKWKMLQLDSDPRAGQVTDSNGQTYATGQAATALSLINWMAQKEGLELGDPAIAPAESLVASNNNWQAFGILGSL